jgi:energy-coupling factor transporter ATP-binding protein EcfA2
MNEERITYFGQTDARNKKVTFGIKAKDRTKHVYVIGKTGMGKSTLLENMAVQDIKNGEGMAFIDPHGKTAELLLEYVPEHRQKDVVYFAPFDMDYPISFNVLESVDPDKRHLVVSGLMSTFKKIWQDAWSARMEYILTNTLLALLEYPDATLLGVNRMLSDKAFRNHVITYITDPSVKTFWVQEFANYTERMAAEAVPAIQNKIGQFTANALIRNMIGQPKSSFDIRKMMDEGKLFIINLSKGRIGESNANLLGGMLITKIYLAALSRSDVPDRELKKLPNFYLFVDEFQSFANESFADILSEARKYKLNLTMAHQYIEQMEEEVRAAVFGNVGTMIVFRVGAYDAEVLEKEFAPQFTAEDIVNLGIFQIYLKLMIDGVSSMPFSATTLPPIEKPMNSSLQKVVDMSRQQYARTREEVEKNIAEWHVPMKPAQKPQQTPQNTPSNLQIPNQHVSKSTQHTAHPVIPNNPTKQSNNTPAPIQPFKKAFEEIKKEIVQEKDKIVNFVGHHSENKIEQKVAEQKPISVNSLIHKPGPKEATPQRVNELKNALASVLGNLPKREENKQEKKEEIKQENKVEEKRGEVRNDYKKEEIKKVTEIKQEIRPEIKKEEIKEISEDKLRDVLKVD